MLYMVTFTIHIPQMLPYIAYMDPMGLKILMEFHLNPPTPNFQLVPFFQITAGRGFAQPWSPCGPAGWGCRPNINLAEIGKKMGVGFRESPNGHKFQVVVK